MAQSERTRQVRRAHSVVEEKLPQAGIGHWFTRLSSSIATLMGSPWAFLIATASIILWATSGPIFGFSDDWMLWVNTGTTVITFLMVFIIQNTQNRDAKAMHLKLDELIRAVPRARKEFMEAEEEDLDEIEREKKIVDEADPAPPADKREQHIQVREERKPHAMSGNGKTKHGTR